MESYLYISAFIDSIPTGLLFGGGGGGGGGGGLDLGTRLISSML